MKIVVPDDHPPVFAGSKAESMVRELGEVALHGDRPSSPQELIERIRDAEGVISIRSAVAYPASVLEACRKLKVLSIWGTGTDHIDLAAAKRLGITVCNTPGVSAVAMAEHTLALMLAAARRLAEINGEVKSGKWPRAMVTQLHGKTLGIVGLGAIGRNVARLGRGIGMRVIGWTFHPNQALATELGLKLVDLPDVFRQSDVVSLHVRQSADTASMVGAEQLGWMKPTAILVNTARGALVDEAALVEALVKKRIAGAALDVFVQEPLPPGHPLLTAPNTVLTPHSGGLTPEALEAGLVMSVTNIRDFLAGTAVNVIR